MAEETIYSKIIRGEIESEILYQDELVTAFVDINLEHQSISLLSQTNLYQR